MLIYYYSLLSINNLSIFILLFMFSNYLYYADTIIHSKGKFFVATWFAFIPEWYKWPEGRITVQPTRNPVSLAAGDGRLTWRALFLLILVLPATGLITCCLPDQGRV